MKLRRNHQRSRSSVDLFRMIIFIIILLALLYLIYRSLDSFSANKNVKTKTDRYSDVVLSYLPSSSGELIRHTHYTLSYIEDHEQAEWVAYELTRELLRLPNVPRSNRFSKDEKVKTGSAGYYDYTGSGYTRGHLASAGDMSFDRTAMEESFLMSNISPQTRPFNNGIWKELEEQTRDWVYQNEALYIISGPVLTDRGLQKIPKEKVSIPKRFYKVLLDYTGEETKGIGFVIPHERSEEHLKSYAMSIDEVEKITGIDFFYLIDDNPDFQKLEANYDIADWKFSDARFKLRVERWNNE